MTQTPINRSASAYIARRLARVSVKAYLCTIGADNQAQISGWPAASLITTATTWDGSPILLLSELAHHTQNITADERASILFDGSGGFSNPQQGPRTAFVGRLKKTRDKRLHSRFLARHPAAAMYAGFGDFHFYRMRVERVHWVGGFSAAQWIPSRHALLAATDCKRIADMEANVLECMNSDHANTVANFGTQLLGKRGKHWRMIGIDPEGCDLACGAGNYRLDFETRVTGADALRTQLMGLDEAAHMAPRKTSKITSANRR